MSSLTLHTADGHVLVADRAEARDTCRGGVVICHPHPLYGGNRFNPVVDALFSALAPAGFTVLRFDFRAAHDHGVGERLDVVAALDALGDVDAPLFIAGYSFGALVALTTDDPRIAGIIAIAPPLTADQPPPRVPTLVVAAGHDQFCPADQAATIVSAWPRTELEVIESADHFLAGCTTQVAARAITWLTGAQATAT